MIVLGCLTFFWTRNYRKVPSGIGPAFFPRIIAGCLIALSIACIVLNLGKKERGEFVQKAGAVKKIIITCALIIGMALLMEHVHPLIGIFLFLIGYLRLLSGESWKATLIISTLGCALLYATIYALRIPM